MTAGVMPPVSAVAAGGAAAGTGSDLGVSVGGITAVVGVESTLAGSVAGANPNVSIPSANCSSSSKHTSSGFRRRSDRGGKLRLGLRLSLFLDRCSSRGRLSYCTLLEKKSTLYQTNAIAFRSKRTGRHRRGRLGLGRLGFGGLSRGGLGLFGWLLLVLLLESCLELGDKVVKGTDCWSAMSVLFKVPLARVLCLGGCQSYMLGSVTYGHQACWRMI
jgi:hypothetical protein